MCVSMLRELRRLKRHVGFSPNLQDYISLQHKLWASFSSLNRLDKLLRPDWVLIFENIAFLEVVAVVIVIIIIEATVSLIRTLTGNVNTTRDYLTQSSSRSGW